MAPRERLLMDRGWRFHLGDVKMHDCRQTWSKVRTSSKGPINQNYDDSGWQQLNLPHDFVVEGKFTRKSKTVKDIFPLSMTDDPEIAIESHGFLPSSVGWYRKTFKLSKRDSKKRIYLVFDGIYRESTFWLNGLYLDRHQSGYNECRMDVTDLLVYGNESEIGNVLAVRVDARQSEGWFYEGGGIYRHVWLEKTEPVAVASHGTFVWTRAVTGKGKSRKAEIEIRTTVRNDSELAEDVQVVSSVVDAKGKTCAQLKEKLCVLPGPGQEHVGTLNVKTPHLWDLEDPYLHTLETEVFVGKELVDRTQTTFGIRTIRFDADEGFFLNDRNIKIKGVCVHQNHAGVGTAMPDKLFEYRIQQLKKIGCNGYRCSHYPQSPELLDACDRLGMLVMDETRSFSSGPEFMRQHEKMIMRDRNHPSIVIYSMANEEGIQNEPRGARMMRTIRRLVKRLDPTRPLTTGNNDADHWGKAAAEYLDVQGCNYRINGFDDFHKKYPERPLIGTENSARIATRGIYEHNPKKGYVDTYDRQEDELWKNRITGETMWQGVMARPFVAGAFIWTGIDYKGEPKPYGWPTVAANFGVLDSCCFPKDNSYFFKTWWNDDDGNIHLFPHWNWKGSEGKVIEVWCYSRGDSVELFLNGKSLGMREMPENSHVSWQVPYEPGVLEAHAYRDGKAVASTCVVTTGKAAAIRLETDHMTINADGEDIAVVNVAVVDSDGLVVPTACNPIQFDVSDDAKIIGVGNGDPSSHEPDKATKRKAFNGLCQVIVQASTTPGEITVTATAKGLAKGSLAIKGRRRKPRKGL